MKLFEFKKYINSVLTEGLSEEKNLNRLTTYILKNISNEIFTQEKHNIYIKGVKENTEYVIWTPDFHVSDTNFKLGNFPEDFQNWIKSKTLYIVFNQEHSDSKSHSKPLGTFIPPSTIRLMYNTKKTFKDIYDVLKEDKESSNFLEIYVKMYYLFYSTLLHELRHAFDYYRTKGKFINPKKWDEYEKRIHSNRSLTDTGDDKIKKLSSSAYIHKFYLKMQHEIDARYSQALHNLQMDQFIGWDDSDEREESFDREKKSFDKVLKNFIIKFEGWVLMNPAVQRKLTKRLYKAWSEFEVENTPI